MDNHAREFFGLKKPFLDEKDVLTLIENTKDAKFQWENPFKKIINVTTMDVDGITAYIFNKRISNQKAVIYLYGGYNINFPQPFHFQFIEQIILNTNACVIMPLYPKLPDNTYCQTYKALHQVYEAVQKYYFYEISIIGDASGGGLALGFSADVVARGLKPLDHTILISPWLDLSLSNPHIKAKKNTDCILNPVGIKKLGSLWAGDTTMNDYLLSPIYAPLVGIKDLTVFVGSEEIFFPDVQRLKDRCIEENIRLNYYEGEGMFHDFLLTPVKEATTALQKMYSIINYGVPHFSVKVANDDDVDELERMLDEENMKYPLFDNRIDHPFINLVIKENEKIVAGLCAYFTCFSIVFLRTVVVDEDYKRLGLGTKLLRQMEFIAKAKGANIIRADAFNFQGKVFFEKNDYLCVGKYDHKTDNFSEFFFIKDL